jgi:hypothetical protein
MDDAIMAEKLYRSFVEEKPYKEYKKLNKITISGVKEFNIEDFKIYESLFFHFVHNNEIELWGVKLNLFNSVGIFDFKVSNIVHTETNEYELLLEPITDKGIYESSRYFVNGEEAENYKICVKDLVIAELIDLD